MHKEYFEDFMQRACVSKMDNERAAMFYLLALHPETRVHIDNIYNFKENSINLKSINATWQTHCGIKTVKLAFNLFNGFSHEEYGRFDPTFLFRNPDAHYMVEALKICLSPYFKSCI